MSVSLIKKITIGWLETNCYLLIDQTSQKGFVIDPGGDPAIIIEAIKKNDMTPIAIINTHGHGDHISSNGVISETYQVPIWIHSLDAPMLVNSELNLSAQFGFEINSPKADRCLNDHDTLTFGESQLTIIHTPGHSKGSICLLGTEWLISGDTLFLQSIGRTDLLGGNYQQITTSIKHRLFTLDDQLIVYPGHGNNTSIGFEKINNPYLGQELRYE